MLPNFIGVAYTVSSATQAFPIAYKFTTVQCIAKTKYICDIPHHKITVSTRFIKKEKLQRMATSGPSDAGGAAPVKDSWPELVGVSSEEAKKKIKEDKPGADVQVVPADAFVTMDFRTNRVRVFVDSNDKVAKAPKIG
ncbi:unnamed protein product [Urochloa humidicola]